VMNWLAIQMEHTEWNGFHFEDLIFPLFIFLAGVSMPFSFDKRMQGNEPKRGLYFHLIKRALTLIFFGLITRGLLWYSWGEFGSNMGYSSVLGRIGLAWFFAAVIYLNTNFRGRLIWFGSILIGYWLIMMLIPVPGYGAGNLSHDGNLAGFFDRIFLPGKLNEGNFDSEGLLSTIPAIATALLGSITGHLIKNIKQLSPQQKGFLMGASGIVLMLVGWLWGLSFPINKRLWTSSFVLYAGGLSLIFLSIFYLVIDVWKFKKWAFPFVVICMNSITIYMVERGIIMFTSTRDYFLWGIIKSVPEAWQPLLNAIGFSLAAWVFLYFLYRKKIFLKV
jgi:predicted acyltransferase